MWREICPQGGRPRSPYIGLRPWATSRFPSILVGYNRESLSELVYLVLYSKLSSCPRAHMSGRAGPTDRSAGLLVGRACLPGQLRPWSVGTKGYPCLSSPRLTCRRSSRDEVMSKRSKGMTPLRSRRVHGDPKKKNPSNACTKSNIKLLECRSRRSKWRRDANLEEPPTWPGSSNTKELLQLKP
jgi:hypothetical protein